jgi:exonuclease-1
LRNDDDDDGGGGGGDDDRGRGSGGGAGVGAGAGVGVGGNGVAVRHNVRQFAGRSLAIDASSWLHKAAYACAERLVESTESGARDAIAEAAYTGYVLDRCRELLINAGIAKIYLVFDGVRVPLKGGTNADREARRRKNLDEARRLKSRGMNREAGEKYLQCVRGTEIMAKVVAAAVAKRWGGQDVVDGGAAADSSDKVKVECVWSPYEADAQLARLCVDGRADAVVTEDSDVLVYSAVTRVPFPIIYKLDRKDGSCDVVTMDWLLNLNPEFDPIGGGGGGGDDGESRRLLREKRSRRRIRRDGDLDYIYNDDAAAGASSSSSSSSSSSPSDEIETNDDDDNGGGGEGKKVAAEYDDAGFAPIRRALPPPPSAASGGRKAKGRRGSGGGGGGKGNDNASSPPPDGALLSVLRSFASKERSEPGSGVRLFVQACVLSGCDYAPNRLSKVGPVTAFRMTREASHRDPSERFGRILRSLPAGSRLIAAAAVPPPASSFSGDDGEEDGGGGMGGEIVKDDDDFRSPSDSDPRDAKVEYEDLLIKSEAVFYYHLVRELSTGNIEPLVGHNNSGRSRVGGGGGDVGEGGGGRTATRLDPDIRFRPCVGGFVDGLTFVGSAAEASTNRPEPLPALLAGGGDRRGPRWKNDGGGGGWMSTANGRIGGAIGPGGGRVHYQPWRSTASAAAGPLTTTTLSREPPKETPMQKYLKTKPRTSTTGVARASKDDNSNPSSARDTVKSAARDGRERDKAKMKGGSPLQIPFAPHVVGLRHAVAAPPAGRPNPFSSYTYGRTSGETDEAEEGPTISASSARANVENVTMKPPSEKSPVQSSSARATMGNVAMKSPFFSSPTVKFDYNGSTPLVERVFEPRNRIDADATDIVATTSEAFGPVEDGPLEVPEDDDNGKSEKQPKQSPATDVRDDVTIRNDSSFDYGIVLESPRRKASPARAGILREFIDRTLSYDNDQQGPRRVSTSPPEDLRRGLSHGGNGPRDVIDLVDDEEAEGFPAASSSIDENHPNVGLRNIFGRDNAKPSSVFGRKFKSPYPATAQKRTAASSSRNANKARPTTSSSALLAGFARQKKTSPASSSFSSANSSGTKRKSRPNFFPMTNETNGGGGRSPKKSKWSERWGFGAPTAASNT